MDQYEKEKREEGPSFDNNNSVEDDDIAFKESKLKEYLENYEAENKKLNI